MQNLNIQWLNIELTTRCTARCPFCARVMLDIKEKKDLNFNALKKIPFEKFTASVLSGSLGEPTMHPEFAEIVEYIHDKNDKLQLRLTTNGFTHDEEWWYKLGKQFRTPELGYAIIALDGLEDTHSIYRVGTDFNQVVKNIKAFNEGGGISLIQTILFKHNEHQLDELKQLSIDLGCRKIFYRPSKQYNDVFEKPIKPIKTQADFVVERDTITCIMIDRNELFLNVDGILTTCYLFNPRTPNYKNESDEFIEKYKKNIPLMDLNVHSYEDIIKNEFFDYVYYNISKLYTCGSVCGCKLSELFNFI